MLDLSLKLLFDKLNNNLYQLNNTIFFNEVSQLSLSKVTSISILLPGTMADRDLLLQQYFQPTQSARGIVTQGDKVLMIYRSHMLDLTKGKIEIAEVPTIAATREVKYKKNVGYKP